MCQEKKKKQGRNKRKNVSIEFVEPLTKHNLKTP